jgi:hypothetical protein
MYESWGWCCCCLLWLIVHPVAYAVALYLSSEPLCNTQVKHREYDPQGYREEQIVLSLWYAFYLVHRYQLHTVHVIDHMVVAHPLQLLAAKRASKAGVAAYRGTSRAGDLPCTPARAAIIVHVIDRWSVLTCGAWSAGAGLAFVRQLSKTAQYFCSQARQSLSNLSSVTPNACWSAISKSIVWSHARASFQKPSSPP